MTCPKCFHILPEDSKFCQYCGVRINVVDNDNGITIDDSLQQKVNPLYISPYSFEESNHGYLPPKAPLSEAPLSSYHDEQKEKNQTVDKSVKIIGGVIGAIIGYFFWPMLIWILIIAGIMILIMYKGLKMKGPELHISFLVILHSITLLLSIGTIAALGSSLGATVSDYLSTDWTTYLFDIVLCITQIVLSCVFYTRKSEGLLIALLSIESLYILLNGYNLYMLASFGADHVGEVIFHIAWRLCTIYLMSKYLVVSSKRESVPAV